MGCLHYMAGVGGLMCRGGMGLGGPRFGESQLFGAEWFRRARGSFSVKRVFVRAATTCRERLYASVNVPGCSQAAIAAALVGNVAVLGPFDPWQWTNPFAPGLSGTATV